MEECAREHLIDGNELGAATDFHLIGCAYRELKKYKEALEAFYEARKYFKAAREVIHVARCDQKIAHCYTELGDAESALAAAQKAVDVFTTAHDHRRLTYASFELGKAQVLSGEVDEGLNTLERVLDIAADAEPKDFEFIVAIERRIAEILHTQGRSEEAIEIERRIASISEILED
jgi:tetratricopeptide (TPR) repeat protein